MCTVFGLEQDELTWLSENQKTLGLENKLKNNDKENEDGHCVAYFGHWKPFPKQYKEFLKLEKEREEKHKLQKERQPIHL